MRGGKPGQAAPKAPRQPTPTKPTPSEPGSTRPVASKPSAAQAKKKAKSEEDDEVISFDGAALRQAIPLSRKPARGRMMRVVCPMCDTPGFASEDAAGKDVKCVNPECLVPIFKAPEIKKKEPEPKEEPEEPSGGLSGVAKVAIALGAVVVVGGAGWFFFLREGSSTGKPAAPQPTAQASGQSTTEPGTGEQPGAAETTGPQAKPEAKEEPKEPTTAPVPQIDPAEVTASALAKMVEAARRRENNRSKPFCRQLTAEAFACAGNIEEAKHQIEQLRLVGKDVPYYQIGAWVAIAWNQLQFGDEEGARQSIEAAWALKDRIPTFGQTGADAAIDLAVPLVVMDRLDDARNLLTEHLGQSTRGELSALLRMVYGDRSYDVDEAVSRLPVAPWKHPEWVSVAIELAAHRGTQKALAWAQAAPDLATQADTLAVWGAAVVRKAVGEGQPVPITDIRSAVESLPPSFQAGVLAQVAYAAARADAQEPAEQLIRFTQEALSRVSTPKEFVIPGMKELYEAEFPDPAPLRTAAAASTELSRTHALLGKTEQAVKDIQRALTFLRASAPSVVAAALRDGEFKRRGRSAIEASLRRLLELETREQARLAANRYRKKCHDLLESAKQRWQLQLRLLARAADSLEQDPVASSSQGRATARAIFHHLASASPRSSLGRSRKGRVEQSDSTGRCRQSP